MSQVTCQLSVSLDGFVAGPNQSLENPLGEGGVGLHEWAFATRAFRAAHGQEGGETGVDDDLAMAWSTNVGATIMGRNMFGPVRGSWGDESWTGWWGDNPPFHTPVFVLTHHSREPVEMLGGTTFHFVTDGIESALSQAKTAAKGKDVRISGGAQTIREYLDAGHIDEFTLHIAPALLGEGVRLFSRLSPEKLKFEQVESSGSEFVTHVTYRVVR